MTNPPLAKYSLDTGKVIPHLLLDKVQNVWVEHPFSLLEANLAFLSRKPLSKPHYLIPTSSRVLPSSVQDAKHAVLLSTLTNLRVKIPQQLMTTTLTVIITRDRASLWSLRLWRAGITGMPLHTGSEYPTLSSSDREFQGSLEFTATPLFWLHQGSDHSVIPDYPHLAASCSSGSLSVYCDERSSRCRHAELCRPPPRFYPCV